MARNPVRAFFSPVIGSVLLASGTLLAGWVVLAKVKIERAFEAMMWALEHSPLPLTAPPLVLANQAINSLAELAFLAAFLCAGALVALLSARTALRPPGESHDGKAEIALRGIEHRVGRPLEGHIKLNRDVEPGDVFNVGLSCTRRYQSGDDTRTETAFSASQDVRAVQGADGWRVPFRFEIPAHAPPSAKGLGAHQGYQWCVTLLPTKGWFAFASRFDLTLWGAPESEVEALEAAEPPQVKAHIDAIEDDLAGLGQGELLPHQRAELRRLSPADLAMAVTVVDKSEKAVKVVLGVALGCMGLFLLVVLLMFAVAKLLAP